MKKVIIVIGILLSFTVVAQEQGFTSELLQLEKKADKGNVDAIKDIENKRRALMKSLSTSPQSGSSEALFILKKGGSINLAWEAFENVSYGKPLPQNHKERIQELFISSPSDKKVNNKPTKKIAKLPKSNKSQKVQSKVNSEKPELNEKVEKKVGKKPDHVDQKDWDHFVEINKVRMFPKEYAEELAKNPHVPGALRQDVTSTIKILKNTRKMPAVKFDSGNAYDMVKQHLKDRGYPVMPYGAPRPKGFGHTGAYHNYGGHGPSAKAIVVSCIGGYTCIRPGNEQAQRMRDLILDPKNKKVTVAQNPNGRGFLQYGSYLPMDFKFKDPRFLEGSRFDSNLPFSLPAQERQQVFGSATNDQ